MQKKIFIVILRYLVRIETIEATRPAHLGFLKKYYDEGIFFASGPQTPRTGGIILAQAQDRQSLLHILHQDPFYTENCAEFQVFEFTPANFSENFGHFMNS